MNFDYGTQSFGSVPSNLYNPASTYAQLQGNAIAAQQQNYNNALRGIRGIISQVSSAQNLAQRGYPTLSKQAQARSDAALAAQQKGIQQLLSGYGGVRDRVNADLTGPLQGWGAYGPAAQMIGKQYTNQAGTLDSRLTSRGIGSDSTVATELQRGPAMDRDLALASLEGNMRQTLAQNDYNTGMGRLNAGFQGLGMNTNQRNLATQYLSQIGLAGLGAGQQFAGQIAGLGMQGIGTLGQLGQVPYPSAGMLQGGGGYGPSTPGQGPTTFGGSGMSFNPLQSNPLASLAFGGAGSAHGNPLAGNFFGGGNNWSGTPYNPPRVDDTGTVYNTAGGSTPNPYSASAWGYGDFAEG